MPFLIKGKTNWKYILVVLILAVIVGGGILYCCLKSQELEFLVIKFPQSLEKSGIPIYKEIGSPTVSSIPLKENETLLIEGVYWGKSIRALGIGNGICFKEKIDVSEDSVVKAKIRIIEVKEGVCSEGEVLEYKILYDGDEIRKIVAQFSYLCPQIEDFINVDRKNPIELSVCLGLYERKFTRFDYGWIPFEAKIVARIGGRERGRGLECFDRFDGSILIDVIKNKVDGIYLGKIRKICVIH